MEALIAPKTEYMIAHDIYLNVGIVFCVRFRYIQSTMLSRKLYDYKMKRFVKDVTSTD